MFSSQQDPLCKALVLLRNVLGSSLCDLEFYPKDIPEAQTLRIQAPLMPSKTFLDHGLGFRVLGFRFSVCGLQGLISSSLQARGLKHPSPSD